MGGRSAGETKGSASMRPPASFYRNRFRIAGLRVAFRVAIDPLDGLLDRGTVGKALLSDISWHIPVGYALGARAPSRLCEYTGRNRSDKGCGFAEERP